MASILSRSQSVNNCHVVSWKYVNVNVHLNVVITLSDGETARKSVFAEVVIRASMRSLNISAVFGQFLYIERGIDNMCDIPCRPKTINILRYLPETSWGDAQYYEGFVISNVDVPQFSLVCAGIWKVLYWASKGSDGKPL